MADPRDRNKLGNECACGTSHYCEQEVMEILGVLRSVSLKDFDDAKKRDDVLRKYDPHYHRRRMRESEDAS